MVSTALQRVRRRPVARVDAARSVVLFSASCAVTVAVTRTYLLLTGYPQIGGTVYHLAHALWGGLALIIAVVVLVALSDTWVFPSMSVLGGVGAGLFVDEVGKFITQKNDYFFPLAATIVYVFLVLLSVAAAAAARYGRSSPRAHLHAALEISFHAADGNLTMGQRTALDEHLELARQGSPSPGQLRLIDALDDAVGFGVSQQFAEEEHDLSRWEQWRSRIGVGTARRLARALLFLQAFGLVFLLLVPLALVLGGSVVPDTVNEVAIGGFGRFMVYLSYAVFGVASVLALLAVIRMRPRRPRVRSATRLGLASMLLMLVVGNALSSYTSQFTILLEAMFQMAAIGALLLWSELALHEEAAAAHPAEAPVVDEEVHDGRVRS